MNRLSALLLPSLLAISTLPLLADLSPEVTQRLRDAVVRIETPDGSSGTGFFISEQGTLLTCAHVLDSVTTEVEVIFADESEAVARFVSFDPVGHDLAALMLVDAKPHAFLELSANEPRPGQRIYQSGNPHALYPALLSTGIVGHHRATHHNFIHDAASSSGSSGSPVVDAQGRVLGMLMSTYNDDSDPPRPNGFCSALDIAAIRGFLTNLAQGSKSDVKVAHVEYLRYPLPVLDVGKPMAGMLTPESDRYPVDLSYAHGYTLDLNAGDLLHLTLKSGDFDCYLKLYDNEASVLEQNDDAPGSDGTDSEITYIAAHTARHVVVATSFERGETGSYQLDANIIQFADPEVIHASFKKADSIKGGAPSHTHPIEGNAGQWLSVWMKSEKLDSMLRLLGPDGSIVAENDDWNAETRDSGILFRLPESGEYRIVATTFEESAFTGPYLLEISRAQK